MTTNEIDTAIAVTMHWKPGGFVVGDVLATLEGMGHRLRRDARGRVGDRLAALAASGEIKATAKGWVKA